MYISDKKVNPYKNHECRVCGEIIPAKEQCRVYSGVESGDGFYTLYFHNDCWDYSRDWDDMDWDSLYPGAVSRKEIQLLTGK